LEVIGKIKRSGLNLDRGYGFIEAIGSPDLFFHCTSLVDLVFDERLIGTEVTFEVDQTSRGPQAVNVGPVNV
jgi:CspA family cold shock protein